MTGTPKTPEALMAAYTEAAYHKPYSIAAAPNPRPFAQRARELCTATNHDDVWVCRMCWALEQRLTPISEMPAMRALLADESLTWKAQGTDA